MAKTPKEFATEHNFDPKSVRRIMRSMTDSANQPGSGSRWEIDDEFEAVLLERMNRSHNRKVVKFTPKA